MARASSPGAATRSAPESSRRASTRAYGPTAAGSSRGKSTTRNESKPFPGGTPTRGSPRPPPQAFELFATLGKSGGYTASFTEAASRLVSLCLRSGIDPAEIAKQLEGIRSPKLAFDKRDKILSVPDALRDRSRGRDAPAGASQVAKALRRHEAGAFQSTVQARLDSVGMKRPAKPAAKENEQVDVSDVDAEDAMQQLIDRGDNPECPDCSAALLLQEGCIKCTQCGYSEC